MDRAKSLAVGGGCIPLPCFFPSISTVKTNAPPRDYLELLVALREPQFLLSAYDIYHAREQERQALEALVSKANAQGALALLDSGNYEAFWKADNSWSIHTF